MPGDLQENEQLAAGLVGAVLTRDLLEPMGCTITSADGVVRLDTPLGEMAIEYSGAQVAGQFCLMAIFTDLDVEGKRRDLYAVKMSWNELWTDTTGQPLSEDRQGAFGQRSGSCRCCASGGGRKASRVGGKIRQADGLNGSHLQVVFFGGLHDARPRIAAATHPAHWWVEWWVKQKSASEGACLLDAWRRLCLPVRETKTLEADRDVA